MPSDEKELPDHLQKRFEGYRARIRIYKRQLGVMADGLKYASQVLKNNAELARANRKLEKFTWEIAYDSDDMTRAQMRDYARKLRVGLGLDE